MDRIVPVINTNLLYLYGIMLKDVSSIEKLDATAPAEFALATNSKVVLCSEPVAKMTLGGSVSAATVYFVPALDFVKENFTKTGATLTYSGTVVADGASLYSATLSSGTLTFAKIGII